MKERKYRRHTAVKELRKSDPRRFCKAHKGGGHQPPSAEQWAGTDLGNNIFYIITRCMHCNLRIEYRGVVNTLREEWIWRGELFIIQEVPW